MQANSDQATQCGFTLVELLLVVAIIGILAAVAIPNLIQTRQAAYSASAVASLRTIHASETSHRAAKNSYASLAALSADGYIPDPALRDGNKSGYNFTINLENPPNSYTATATPVTTPNASQHYFVDATGVIRYHVGSAASFDSDPIK